MCLFAPLSKAIYDSDAIRLDARPITELIHRTGDWALIFLLVALAVRPLSRILRFNQLLDVRRMIVGRCNHNATMNADWLPGGTPLRSLCPRMVCTACVA
jgi:hypothetical protein